MKSACGHINLLNGYRNGVFPQRFNRKSCEDKWNLTENIIKLKFKAFMHYEKIK